MGRTIEKIINCQNGRDRFVAIFEEKEYGKWYGIGVRTMPPFGFLDKYKIKKEVKNHNRPTSGLKGLDFSSIMMKVSRESQSDTTVRGEFYSGSIECPYCGNRDFFSCGTCKTWTCRSYQANVAFCSVCEENRTITGTIKEASGNVNQNSGYGKGKKF